jgi:hypothetical protein
MENLKEIDREELLEFSKALKDYVEKSNPIINSKKTTGAKQCLTILQTLMESNVTMQLLKVL